MAITQNKKHNHAQIKAIRGPFGIHYAKLVTKRKGKFIQWLSEADYTFIKAQFNGIKERSTRN
jgi:hypothetical protein